MTAKTTNNRKTCNCRNKDLCSLDGKCLKNNVIYEATGTASGTTSNYIGMTENDFKTRFNNHKLSFRNRNHSHDTVLSKYIWELKSEKCENYTFIVPVLRLLLFKYHETLPLTIYIPTFSADRSQLLAQEDFLQLMESEELKAMIKQQINPAMKQYENAL